MTRAQLGPFLISLALIGLALKVHSSDPATFNLIVGAVIAHFLKESVYAGQANGKS